MDSEASLQDRILAGISIVPAGKVLKLARKIRNVDKVVDGGKGKVVKGEIKDTRKATTKLDEIKSLIKNGKIKGNNIISKIDDNTQILFRKDTGVNAHPIRPNYPNAIDHYNVEIQTKTSAGKWKSRESYHIVVDKDGNIIDRF